MKILVVDDSATIRTLVIKQLNQLGYKDYDVAANGVEALSKMNGIELVLTDWEMPFMNGLTFVKKLRSTLEHQHVRIIFITSLGRVENVKLALKNGADDYIVKPFSAATLKDKLERIHKLGARPSMPQHLQG
jgi:two-component system chemotaxis response regulator CheY